MEHGTEIARGMLTVSLLSATLLCGGCDMKKKTHEEFLSEVDQSKTEILGRYQTKRDRIPVRCRACGHEWHAWPQHLIRGAGCRICGWAKQRVSMRGKNKVIADHGNWIVLDVSTPKYPTAKMFIDRDQYERIKGMGAGRFYAQGTNQHVYVRVRIDRRDHWAHRLVLNAEREVDHIDGNGLNNRTENLRQCTRSQNQMNRKLVSTNTSGVTGVSWHKGIKKWVAQIKRPGSTSQHIGSYDLFDDAVAARRAAEIKYFGEYRHDG